MSRGVGVGASAGAGAGGSVVVIGGGVIGLACAHYLQRAGWRVTVLDRGDAVAACSHANCGYLAASHVLPLAEPGVIGKTLRSMFKPDSPFRVKPRLDPSLWAWFAHFARRCNREQMIADGRGIAPLLRSSGEAFEELLGDGEESAGGGGGGLGPECEWEKKGCLFVHRHRETFEAFAATDALVQREFGLAATRYEGAALCDLEPAIKPGAAAGAWHYEGDWHLRPDKLMAAWREQLAAAGVVFHEPFDFQTFGSEDGAARAALGAGRGGETESFEADAFVLATGAWTPLVARAIGCHIPIQPGKGYSITMARPARCPAIPMIFKAEKVAVTPMRSGYRIGSTMEFCGYDRTLNPRRLAALRRAAAHYLHTPGEGPAEEEWFGWRPMTYDTNPIIDRTPAAGNVMVAAGHGMLGLSMAPATGRLVAEMLGGEEPHIDPTPYRVGRFKRSAR